MDDGFKGGVRIGGEEVGAGDAKNGEATDAIERRKVSRIGASLRCPRAVAADLHSLSMVAATKQRLIPGELVN